MSRTIGHHFKVRGAKFKIDALGKFFFFTQSGRGRERIASGGGGGR